MIVAGRENDYSLDIINDELEARHGYPPVVCDGCGRPCHAMTRGACRGARRTELANPPC